MRQHKTILLGLVLTLFASFPLAAMAGDRVSDRPSDQVTDRIVDKVTDRAPSDVTDVKPTDRKITDRKITDRKPTDVRPTDKVRPTDERPLDRCVHVADNPRRCIDDAHDHVNVRHLIWRLIKAHEWEKLVRLLLRLGLL